MIAINTGLRFGEIASLKWGDVHLIKGKSDDRQNHLKIRDTKNDTNLEMPLNPDAVRVLRKWQSWPGKNVVSIEKKEALVFADKKGNKLVGIRHHWKPVFLEAGLPKGYRFHDLRHHFASKLVSMGHPLFAVQALLNHSNPQMTQRYAHHAPEYLHSVCRITYKGFQMIDLAAQFRFWTADLSGISDADWVKAALRGDKESARGILIKSYWRMYIRAFKHDCQPPVIKLLGDLAFGEIPLNVLQKQKPVKAVMRNFRAKIHQRDDYRKFLKEYDSILGDEFLTYLENCFDRAVKEYRRPRLPDKMRRRKNWLAIGFNLAWAKDNAEGQSENLERNSDITQSVYLLIEQYDKKHGNLRSGINRVLNGESDALPGSIDRLIKLKGFIDGGPYITHYRKVIARLARRTIFRFETAEQGSRNADHRKLQIASHIFAGCSKACKKTFVKNPSRHCGRGYQRMRRQR